MRIITWAVPAILLWVSTAAQATVTLTFSGTYYPRGPEDSNLFGLTGPTIPFSYQITYDPALDTNTQFFPVGANVYVDATAVHEWHGYSASGITASNVTLGTKTWTAADLRSDLDMWFDTDISLFAPTRCWIWFGDGFTFLHLGGTDGDVGDVGDTIYLTNGSRTRDEIGHGEGVSQPMTITSSVPEPGTMALAACAAAGLLSSRCRKRARVWA